MKNILILDIETTGFLNKGGKIVEIGIVELDLDTGNKKILFDKVTHEKGITLEEVENSWIINNSDLKVDDVRYSKRLDFLKNEIQEIINSYPLGVTAYNNKFDFDFLEDRKINIPKKLACPMILSTDIVKIPSSNKYSDYKWPKVEEAYDYFFPENDYVEKHRGADDAFHEADIVYELYKRGVFNI